MTGRPLRGWRGGLHKNGRNPFLVPMLPCGNAYNKPRRVNPLKIGRSVMDSRLRGNDGEIFAGMTAILRAYLRPVVNRCSGLFVPSGLSAPSGLFVPSSLFVPSGLFVPTRLSTPIVAANVKAAKAIPALSDSGCAVPALRHSCLSTLAAPRRPYPGRLTAQAVRCSHSARYSD